MVQILSLTAQQVAHTLAANWPFLLAGILIAAGLKLFVAPARIVSLFSRRRAGAVVVATGAAVATPLCSCGTMAVILGMLASAVPWAPVVAFMVASPLTSPQELLLSAGLFGWPFALAFFVASVALGLAGGAAAHVLEARGWLKNQARLAGSPKQAQAAVPERPHGRALALAFAREAWVGGRKLVPLFLAFAFVGYFLNNLMPASWVERLFGHASLGVPLAATLGLPLYLNTEASLPLVRAFIDHGATAGSALAFLITGAGTSIGAVAGAFTIARWRVIGLVVATLWVGALVSGFAYDAIGGTVVTRPAAAPEQSIDRDLTAMAAPDAQGGLPGAPDAVHAVDHTGETLRAADAAGVHGFAQPVDAPAAGLTGRPQLCVADHTTTCRTDAAERARLSRGSDAAVAASASMRERSVD